MASQDALLAEKAALRARMRDVLAALPARRRALEEELVNAAVQATKAWAGAGTVLLYHSVGHEFSVASLGNVAFRQGKRVCFPRVTAPRDGGMVLHEVPGWHALSAGSFAVPEPDAAYPETDPDDVALAIVPALAWDRGGHRLGQGGGFYDRLLDRIGGLSWGVGFDAQCIRSVPRAPHDRPVDRLWTAATVQA